MALMERGCSWECPGDFSPRNGRLGGRVESFCRLQILQPAKLRVETTAGEKFVVGASFDDSAGVEHDDSISGPDGRESMGDDEGGAAAFERVQRFQEIAFGLDIQGAGRFVENQNRRILQ